MFDFAFREEAARGARLLDRKVPGWADKIDLARFSMRHTRNDVLGQLFGTYLTGLDALFWSQSAERTRSWSYRHGFAVDPQETHEGENLALEFAAYRALTAAWVEQIETRRREVAS